MLLDLSEGGWTPALRAMALEVMAKMLTRPIARTTLRPTSERKLSLSVIRCKLVEKDYSNLADWQKDVITVIRDARASEAPSVNDICDELEESFAKSFRKLKDFSNFRFRDACTAVFDDLQAVENEW
jgi:hypothetical protein